MQSLKDFKRAKYIMNNIIQLKKGSFAAVFFISLIVISTIEAAPHPKQTHQHDILRGDYDLENESSADTEKYDLQGSSSFGYGYYSYPYLGSGFYGGHYPYYGGIYGLGYPYYGGYYGGYHGFHGHYW